MPTRGNPWVSWARGAGTIGRVVVGGLVLAALGWPRPATAFISSHVSPEPRLLPGELPHGMGRRRYPSPVPSYADPRISVRAHVTALRAFIRDHGPAMSEPEKLIAIQLKTALQALRLGEPGYLTTADLDRAEAAAQAAADAQGRSYAASYMRQVAKALLIDVRSLRARP